MDKPYVWQMVKEAVEHLKGKATYTQIKDYIKDKYGEINESTINCQIIACTVNHPTRIHYSDNKKPRICNTSRDFLFSTGYQNHKGQVELYDPAKHGNWQIKLDNFGKLSVFQSGFNDTDVDEEIENLSEQNFLFPFESHLRDFIVKNIESIKHNNHNLKLYIDNDGREGIEYPTDVGPIDILAIDENGDFIVFELKLSRGEDKALGQLLRYMGWIKHKLSKDKKVFGIIVAQSVNEKLKYAASITENIVLFEYQVNFKISEINL